MWCGIDDTVEGDKEDRVLDYTMRCSVCHSGRNIADLARSSVGVAYGACWRGAGCSAVLLPPLYGMDGQSWGGERLLDVCPGQEEARRVLVVDCTEPHQVLRGPPSVGA